MRKRQDLSNKHHLTTPGAVQLSTPEQLQDALDDCEPRSLGLQNSGACQPI
jgi:hypothetical protein